MTRVKWSTAMDDRLNELIGMHHAHTIARVITRDFGVTVTMSAVHDRWQVVGCGVHAGLNPGRWHLADIAREIGVSRSAVFHVAKRLDVKRIGQGHFFYVSEPDMHRLFEHYGHGKPHAISTHEASHLLHADQHTIAKWCRLGKVPGAFQVGKNWRVPVESIRHRDTFGKVTYTLTKED